MSMTVQYFLFFTYIHHQPGVNRERNGGHTKSQNILLNMHSQNPKPKGLNYSRLHMLERSSRSECLYLILNEKSAVRMNLTVTAPGEHDNQQKQCSATLVTQRIEKLGTRNCISPESGSSAAMAGRWRLRT